MRWREKREAGGQMKRGSNEMEIKEGSWRIDEEIMRWREKMELLSWRIDEEVMRWREKREAG